MPTAVATTSSSVQFPTWLTLCLRSFVIPPETRILIRSTDACRKKGSHSQRYSRRDCCCVCSVRILTAIGVSLLVFTSATTDIKTDRWCLINVGVAENATAVKERYVCVICSLRFSDSVFSALSALQLCEARFVSLSTAVSIH